jgi:hypothetical protein
MSPKLQSIIDAAQELSPLEQLQLIEAVSEFLQLKYQITQPTVDFWNPQSVEELVRTQNTQPVSNIAELAADFWPEQETADDIIEYLYQQRQEDRLKD